MIGDEAIDADENSALLVTDGSGTLFTIRAISSSQSALQNPVKLRQARAWGF